MATQITAIHYEMFIDMFTVHVSDNGKPAGVLKAIADAQETQAAELPSDCAMPIDVPNRFTLLPA